MWKRTPQGFDAARRAQAALSAAGFVVLAGCAFDPLSDPPVPLEEQPLEVVVNGDTRPDSPCLLNVDVIRAGDHAVTVIGESGYARVRIVDEQQRVVFRTDNAGQRIEIDAEGQKIIIGGEGDGTGPVARLGAGTFTVHCRPRQGEPGETTLRVLPARPASQQ